MAQQNKVRIVKCEITNLPNEMFWRGTLVRDLARLRILPASERKQNGRGKPDVEIKSLIAGTYYCFRRDVNQFMDTSGSKLRVRNLHTNKQYIVQTQLQPIKIGYLPPSKTHKGVRTQYTLNGRAISQNTYVIFPLDDNNNVMWDKVKILSPSYFNRVVKSVDTMASLKKRVNRWKQQSGMTVTQKYLNADFRIVARIENATDYSLVGFVLSYAQNGKMMESDFSNAQVEELAKAHRIRNMTPSTFQLTYGNILDLPTKPYIVQKVKK